MAHRKDIVIKTKYGSKQECIEECRDIKKKTIMAMSFNSSISGTVSEFGEFNLSSRAKGGAAMFEFTGQIEEDSDGVFMVGEINPKKLQARLIYGMIVLFTIAGLGFIITFNPVLMLFGVLSLIVPWLNFAALKYSDHLYKIIIKKVT